MPQNNNQTENYNITLVKPQGSVVILVLWIIFFWPIAVVYALIRSWGVPTVVQVSATKTSETAQPAPEETQPIDPGKENK